MDYLTWPDAIIYLGIFLFFGFLVRMIIKS